MHGAGNDYIYISPADEYKQYDWSELSVTMSDRHTGIGSDGIILALPSERADLKMRMFNADGSEGKMCGNGIRCLVSFAIDESIIEPNHSPVSVETQSGILTVYPNIEEGKMISAQVSMGSPGLTSASIPVTINGLDKISDYPLRIAGEEYKINCVSMGNPHAVAFLDTPVEDIPLDKIGPIVENHEIFPEGVNFEIVNIIDRKHVKVRVWERGSGLTLACGTGACAVAVSAHLHKYIDDDVVVTLPGGDLLIRWPGSGNVVMEGPVDKVFEGEWTK